MSMIINRNSAMTLFSDPNGFESHSVRFVLMEKGISAEIWEVDLNNKPAELADLNPYNSIPTLVDRELTLYDTNIILEYLDDRFPHPPLLPQFPIAKAQTRIYTKRVFVEIANLVKEIQNTQGRKLGQLRKILADKLISFSPIFKELPYFMSENISMPDCVLVPLLWRLKKLGVELPRPKAKGILDYMDKMFERDSFQKSLSEDEKKYND